MAKDPKDKKTIDIFCWLTSQLIIDYNDGSY
jgi:hypothetical protein